MYKVYLFNKRVNQVVKIQSTSKSEGSKTSFNFQYNDIEHLRVYNYHTKDSLEYTDFTEKAGGQNVFLDLFDNVDWIEYHQKLERIEVLDCNEEIKKDLKAKAMKEMNHLIFELDQAFKA